MAISKSGNDNELFYQTAIKLQERQTSLLFQRVNFFLISTAFLIGALAALIVSKEHTLGVFGFANLVCGTGLFLALLFTIINYINSRIIGELHTYIRQLEKGRVGTSPYEFLENTADQFSYAHMFFVDLLKRYRDFGLNLILYTKAQHTWLIPLGFIFFGILAWIFTLISFLCIVSIIVLLPVAFIVILGILLLIIRQVVT